jgi:hypothetical protein
LARCQPHFEASQKLARNLLKKDERCSSLRTNRILNRNCNLSSIQEENYYEKPGKNFTLIAALTLAFASMAPRWRMPRKRTRCRSQTRQ